MADEVEEMAPLRLQRVASSAPWSLVALILLYGGLAGHSALSRLTGFGGAVLFTVVSYRAARLRLLLGPEVVVVGWLGSKRYPWSDIEKFVLNDKGVAIRMRGGIEVAIAAYPRGGSMIRKLQDSINTDLEQVVDRAERFRKTRRGSAAG
ncbi:MAG TPA: hypothetical protein VFE65_18730 [Pseudonocardia sp.]|nr:hypothetical protein [Pseudonocardia sp.]